jgi:hypothetical protein
MMLAELHSFEIRKAHSVMLQADGSHRCRCGWVLPDLGQWINLLAIAEHYEGLS